MLNLAIFIKCPENKNADYNRQQVSERGVLEIIDSFNEPMMEKFDLNYDMMIYMYELLHIAEASLQKNANDPRVKKALNDFTNNKVTAAIGNKEPEPEPAGEDKENNGIADEPGVSGDEVLKKAEEETLKEAEEIIESKKMENNKPEPEPEPEPAPESTPDHEPENEDMKEEEEAPTQEPTSEPESEKEDVKEENNAPEQEPEKESEAPAEKAAPKAKRTTKKKAE